MIVPGSASALLLKSAAPTGYNVERSLRFNSSDSAYLSRTPSVAGNRKTWTWAGWVKRGLLNGTTTYQQLFSAGTANTVRDVFFFDADVDDTLAFYSIGGLYGGTLAFRTDAVFRDPSAWYHIVLVLDTPNATSTDRFRLYVNGVRQTFSTYVAPTQNADSLLNLNTDHAIGRDEGNNSQYLDGYLADIHFIDGQALDPTSFTETDATTGQLIPKAYTGTYGTNGFRLPFSDNSTAAALGTDTSGNGNDWTVNNIAVDNPTTLPAVTFDGSSGTNLTVSSAGSMIGTNDFTVEFFIYSNSTADRRVFSLGQNNASGSLVIIKDSDGIRVNWELTANTGGNLNVVGSGWHHVAAVRSSNNLKVYIDGELDKNYGTVSVNFNASTLYIGDDPSVTSSELIGSISNLRVVQSALYTSNFTPPTAPLTNVTNTKLLCCQSSSSTTAATVSPGTITANGAVYATTLTDSQPGNDSLVDTPSSTGVDAGNGGEVRGNYCTFNPLNNGGVTLTNGNLDWQRTAGGSTAVSYSTIAVSSGKWYFETTLNGAGGGVNWEFGVARVGTSNTIRPGTTANGWGLVSSSNTTLYKQNNNTLTTIFTGTLANGDIIGVALDLDNGRIWFARNNTWLEGSPSTGTGASYTNLSGTIAVFAGGDGSAVNGAFNAGARPFAYTAPSGFKALCDTNLPAPVVAQPSTVMDVVLWTGDGTSSRSVDLPISADLVWAKKRSGAASHQLADTVRGSNSVLLSNSTGAESNPVTGFVGGGISSISSTAFTISQGTSTNDNLNQNSATFVAWTWDAGSSTVTNTQGSITSTVRANASAGFSVIGWTGASSGTANIGHGLGVAPAMIITRPRNATSNWVVYHRSVGNNAFLRLNTTDASVSSSACFGTGPTSTVFTLNQGSLFAITGDYIGYAFAPVAGYSSFGSYVGNGSATDGPFVYTGFRPRWVMVKRSDSTSDWFIFDTSRPGYNLINLYLMPNNSSAEGTDAALDIVSNGFKWRSSAASINGSGATFIYAAFAESPFQYARAR